MTNKEAIEQIEYAIITGSVDDVQCGALKMAINALEKQTPKKPEIIINENMIKSEREVPCCAVCLQELEESIESWFCPHCGHAIDWSK